MVLVPPAAISSPAVSRFRSTATTSECEWGIRDDLPAVRVVGDGVDVTVLVSGDGEARGVAGAIKTIVEETWAMSSGGWSDVERRWSVNGAEVELLDGQVAA